MLEIPIFSFKPENRNGHANQDSGVSPEFGLSVLKSLKLKYKTFFRMYCLFLISISKVMFQYRSPLY